MFKNTLINKSNTSSRLFKLSKKFFKMLTPEEYLVNITESIRRTGVESCKLKPLPEASKYK